MSLIRRVLPFFALPLLGAQALPAAAQATPFVGQIMCAGFNFAPIGWLPTDGRLLPINQNAALFSLLGTTYGGDGITTFALPDTRGRVILGAGAGPGLTVHNPGELGGTEAEVLRVDQMPSHVHLYAPPASSADATLVSPSGAVPANKARTTLYAPASSANLVEAVSQTGSAGGASPVATMPPYLAVDCFIAVQGVFPARP